MPLFNEGSTYGTDQDNGHTEGHLPAPTFPLFVDTPPLFWGGKLKNLTPGRPLARANS